MYPKSLGGGGEAPRPNNPRKWPLAYPGSSLHPAPGVALFHQRVKLALLVISDTQEPSEGLGRGLGMLGVRFAKFRNCHDKRSAMTLKVPHSMESTLLLGDNPSEPTTYSPGRDLGCLFPESRAKGSSVGFMGVIIMRVIAKSYHHPSHCTESSSS